MSRPHPSPRRAPSRFPTLVRAADRRAGASPPLVATRKVRLAGALAAVGVSGCAALAPTPDPRPVVRGPVPVVTNGPIVASLFPIAPRRAATEPEGRTRIATDLSYSSVFENGRDPVSRVVLDGEIARATFGVRHGVGPSTDVEVQLSARFASAGFLDAFVEGWHDAFGLPNGGREARPRDDYAMRVDQGGRRAFELASDEVLLGDVPVLVTQSVLDERTHGVGLALRAGVELPLGSESKGGGNGGVDWGGGVLLERSFGRFTFTAGGYALSAATPDSFQKAGLAVQDPRAVHVGLETRWNDDASILVGLRWNTAATRDVFIEEIDGDVLELDTALAWDVDAVGRFHLGLSEDVIAASGPDWTAFVGWSTDL